ncbi:MAG TPA: trypsin-like peptidase domain-containing protein [Anaerolineae bacterium]|nr:trypsin-like peptidase domain-containing protein [Anaerolineae bacterium]
MNHFERRMLLGLGCVGGLTLLCAGSLGVALLMSNGKGAELLQSQRGRLEQLSLNDTAPETPADGASSSPARINRPAPSAAPRAELPLRGGATTGMADLSRLYQQVNPGVVAINIEQVVDLGQGPGRARGSGSGWIYDEQGHIVTNKHVAGDASSLEVVFSDGSRRKARVVGMDGYSDLAVLKVDDLPESARALPVLENLDDLLVGHPVIAIGNPFGKANSMTSGIISALGRVIPAADPSQAAAGQPGYQIPQTIQTDAAINPGNSGGPLLDLTGQVIGVNAQIETMNIQAGGVPGNSGVGFAIPASVVNKVVPQLIASGKARWSYLGIQGSSDFTVEMAQANNLAEPRGAYVIGVQPDGPATQVLKGAQNLSDQNAEVPVGGDVITAIDGEPIDDFDDLLSYVALRTEPGQEVRLTVLRGGTEQEITMTVGERPSRD